MRETGVDNVVRSLLAKLDILMTVAGLQSAGQTKKEGVPRLFAEWAKGPSVPACCK